MDRLLTKILQLQLITTKPVIYLVNLTMKDYVRQKCKYLPKIVAWVKEHGGQGSDIIPFSVEFEEKLWAMREDKDALDAFVKESKVPSRLGKITTEGIPPSPFDTHTCEFQN
jgi:obg-like ATPase 1